MSMAKGERMQKNIVDFIGCDAEYDEAEVVIFGAPFDSTTSFRPTQRRPSGRGPVSPERPYGGIPTGWRYTARIRTKN